jgi:hypothetical protein
MSNGEFEKEVGIWCVKGVYDVSKDCKDSTMALPEKLAWMVASEFIWDATIRFKLGLRASK